MQLEPKFLLRDYKRSLKDKLSPPCGKPVGAQVHHSNIEEHDADQKMLVCYNCGVACDMKQMRDERRDYLAMLNAWKPSTDTTAHDTVVAKQKRIAEGGAPNLLHENQEPVRMRLRFTKRGADAMTGHLDLTRKIIRTMRRADLPIWYTEGYSPKAALSFGPALSLGVEALGELCEVKLTQYLEPAQMLARLNAVSERGIRWTGAWIVEPGSVSLSKTLSSVGWRVQLPNVAAAKIQEAAVRLDALESWKLEVPRKRQSHEFELTDWVQDLRVVDSGETLIVEFQMRASLGAQLKVGEVFSELLGEIVEVAPWQLTRLPADGTPRPREIQAEAASQAP